MVAVHVVLQGCSLLLMCSVSFARGDNQNPSLSAGKLMEIADQKRML